MHLPDPVDRRLISSFIVVGCGCQTATLGCMSGEQLASRGLDLTFIIASTSLHFAVEFLQLDGRWELSAGASYVGHSF